MSKADYLSKYLTTSSSDKKTKKKKVKKSSSGLPSQTIKSNIIIDQPKQLILPTQDDDDDVHEAVDDDDDEYSPIKVQTSSNKGFKRIDTGEVVNAVPKPEKQPKEELQPNQETVYRDSSGRIIDINDMKNELLRKKQEKSKKEEVTEVRTSKEDQELQEKAVFKKTANTKFDDFEDPLNSFTNDPKQEEVNDVGYEKYVYNKGVNLPNRFNIPSGYFWDGIDRSNGFEDLKMKKMNELSFNKLDSKINETYEIDLE